MHKPIILTFVGHYLPGHKSGGPIRTISNMVERLGDELDFRIVTSDRDYMDTQPYPNVSVDCWNAVGKANVLYVSPGNRSLRNLARPISDTPHDVLYLNSFFNPAFTIRSLLARRLGLIPKRPTVIAPRGEFTGGSSEIKRWKKTPYVAIARALGLYADLTWQASSEHEARDIRKVMGPTAKRVVVAPNLPAAFDDVAAEEWQTDRTPGSPFRVCYIARISPEKNLEYALRVLAAVTIPMEFNIYGLVSDKPYWQHCQELIKRLPAHVNVRFHGVLDHESVAQMLAKQDLLFFPTLGENFGHIIFEALSSGLPVLISDLTPWRNLEAIGVGWDLPLNDTEGFRAVLEAQGVLDSEARAAQRRLARQYAKRIASDEKVLSSNLALFRDLLPRKQDIYNSRDTKGGKQ